MPQKLDSPFCHQNWVLLALDILLEIHFKLMNSPRPLAYSLLWQQVVGISAASLNSIPKTHRTQTYLYYFSSNKQDSFLDLEQLHSWNEHTLTHLYTHTLTLTLSPTPRYEEPWWPACLSSRAIGTKSCDTIRSYSYVTNYFYHRH